MRVLSLGAGVQSTAVLLMVREGEVEADHAIFADTMWEPRAVYEHLAWLESVSTIPVHRVSLGALRKDALEGAAGFAAMPLYLRNLTGGRAQLRRQCTYQYKIRPIRRKVRDLMAGSKEQVQMLFGISTDEVQRMRQSDVRYIRNLYPLVERGMSRAGCESWMRERGYPSPPKSSCIGCPFHDNRYWRALRDRAPDEFADAVAFDEAIRNGRTRVQAEAFIHFSRSPLATVDLSTHAERGQGDLFDAECLGVCGV